MMYQIFLFVLVILIILFSYPFLIKFDVRLNVLRLKGSVKIIFFNLFKFEVKVRVKHGYIYINHKNKLRKEKISKSNFNIVYITNLINQIYFREQFLSLDLVSNFGYQLDSNATATISGFVLTIVSALCGKLKNNKKSAHIFVSTNPKYNEDIFNFRVVNTVRISIFDLIYTCLCSLKESWRGYEKRKRKS